MKKNLLLVPFSQIWFLQVKIDLDKMAEELLKKPEQDLIELFEVLRLQKVQE